MAILPDRRAFAIYQFLSAEGLWGLVHRCGKCAIQLSKKEGRYPTGYRPIVSSKSGQIPTSSCARSSALSWRPMEAWS